MVHLGDAGAASTYSRFFPMIKQRYDYGVVIFNLTFNLIAISGYRVENLSKMARQRISTIVIGCALCFVINVAVFPIWAGDDFHNSIIRNLEGLAGSLQGKLWLEIIIMDICLQKFFLRLNMHNLAIFSKTFTVLGYSLPNPMPLYEIPYSPKENSKILLNKHRVLYKNKYIH